jgi:hypothetical protein
LAALSCGTLSEYSAHRALRLRATKAGLRRRQNSASFFENALTRMFAKIQRDVIDRGLFTSVADLSRKLRKYIQAYAKSAKPFRLDLYRSTPSRHGIAND